MASIPEKIQALEDEMARTQKNKKTEYHIGILKAKIAKLRRELMAPKKGGGSGSGGFDVRKTGDATVVFIGLPSVGKSSILNVLTNQTSKTAAYNFTTLTCIPGLMEYNGAKIQLLDLPGIIEGAHSRKGRGREVLAVARNADLVLLILDVFQPQAHTLLRNELEKIGIRLDTALPEVHLKRSYRGGLKINTTIPLTHLDEKRIAGIMGEYGLHNGYVTIRQDINEDELIDVLTGNRHYVPSLTVLNKIDLVSSDYQKQLNFPHVPISAEKRQNVEALKKAIYDKLNLIRIYSRPRMGEADMKEPLLLRSGSTIADACKRLANSLLKDFKYAQVWGPSAAFPGQKVGTEHVLKDGDIITICNR